MEREHQTTEVDYRNAREEDLPGIASVLLEAFPQSVEHYVGGPVKPAAVADALAACLEAEPAAFTVAESDGKIAGYVFSPSYLPNVFKTALEKGYLTRGIWRWMSGRYGLGFRPVFIALRNWISMWRESQSEELHSDARILSIAVSPHFQGLGIGTRLMQTALDYLRSKNVDSVRLEVRPDNPPAIHIYEKLGFVTKGRTRDSQGDWLIMLKDFR